jgi:hypothetical protein
VQGWLAGWLPACLPTAPTVSLQTNKQPSLMQRNDVPVLLKYEKK